MCAFSFCLPFCSIQLCVNVQLPPEFGGVAGEAIYIGAFC